MVLGYDKPLYILPFDHRHSYVTGMFHFTPPLTHAQREQVADSKKLIYEGFKQALANGVSREYAGILVDEEFGADILRDALRNGYITAVSTEKSGEAEFQFEYGAEYARHIEEVNPTFVKVLVRYNPEDDPELNRRQSERLQELSDYCRRDARRFMFELLVPPTRTQLALVHGDKSAYDRELRPRLMCTAIKRLQAAGVEPDVWKIEGLDEREDCEHMVEVVRRDDRRHAACIVLGRGADAEKVMHWLETAASVAGFIGFAVGRTSFWDAVAEYVKQKISRAEAVSRIARRYSDWAGVFERAREKGVPAI